MSKIITVIGSFLITILALFVFVGKHHNSNNFVQHSKTAPMPLYQDGGNTPLPFVIEDDGPILRQSLPVAQRDAKYSRYLGATVEIRVNHGMGSGAIIGYNPKTHDTYVATAGHLWKDAVLFNARNVEAAHIRVFYKEQKLSKPQDYTGRILYRNFSWGRDMALISFQADWEPQIFPIAPLNYQIKEGVSYSSCGCDYDSEPARYGVEFCGYETRGTLSMLCTKFNGPRPGRSGGGVLTSDGWYIATVIATEDHQGRGRGRGFNTSLKVIHETYSKLGYDWLLQQKPKILNRVYPPQQERVTERIFAR